MHDHLERVCIPIFSKIKLVDQSKLRTQIYLPKNYKLHKFSTCNKNFEKSRLSDMQYPLTDIQSDFEINRLTRYQIIAKRNNFHRRQTDREICATTIGSFFPPKK